MNFLLSAEQLEIQDTIARYLADTCDSVILHREIESPSWQSQSVWQGLCELGISAIGIPEAYDGLGMEMIDCAVVAEELGRAAAPTPYFGHTLCAMAIAELGSDQQKQAWLPRLASGEVLGTVALAEGNGSWQPDQWQLVGGDTLSGEKTFVPFAEHAGVMVVGTAGGQLMLVTPDGAHTTFSAVAGIDQTRKTSSVTFSDSPAEKLGAAHQGDRLRDAALVLLAADAYGGATRALSMTVDYANVREQFGQPIGKFQGLKHQLANIAVEIEPARGLYWYAAHAFDHIVDDSPRAAALAKAHLGDRYLQAARDCVEAH